MPPVRSSASERCSRLVLLILSFSEIMPSYSRCVEKRLSYIAILALFSRQFFSCVKCTRANMRSSCDIYSVSATKCMLLCTRYSRLVPYLIYYRVRVVASTAKLKNKLVATRKKLHRSFKVTAAA